MVCIDLQGYIEVIRLEDANPKSQVFANKRQPKGMVYIFKEPVSLK